jgi:hypothetical protein
MAIKNNRDYPLSPTPKPSQVSSGAKPPVKKYTAQDSINYSGMQNRQNADSDKAVQNFPKINQPALNRIERRADSMANSPYFKAKAKVSVKNGVTTSTLKK